MRAVRHILLAGAVAAWSGSPVAALELPEHAYETLTAITLAATADSRCDGLVTDKKALERTMLALFRRLAGEGIDPTASVQHLETEAGQAEIARRVRDVRARHGVAAEGDAALCDAIRAEVGQSKSLAAMVKSQ